MKLRDVHSAYFVGIGGIGMSALARYFKLLGMEVSGYDRTSTELTRELEKEGIAVHYTEDVEGLPVKIDLVVYTPAVPAAHAELVYFREKGILLMKRSEVLGLISRDKKTVAVAGTHGKTTTSTILTWLLREGGVDCTAFLGGIARDFSSNFVAGEGEWVVVEADEFDRSFLHLTPEIAIILSVEPDHLDIYGDAEQILETGFRAFARKIRDRGTLWVKHTAKKEIHHEGTTYTFGLEAGEARGENIRVEDGVFAFDYRHGETTVKGLKLSLPGRHNIENAVAALSVAFQLGVLEDDARSALARFGGIHRRFERMAMNAESVYIDDYAHHPSELRAAIDAAKELYPNRKVTGIFQPHLYSRTRDFAAGFAKELEELDELFLLDIYPAREEPVPGVSSDMLAELIQNTRVHRVNKENLMEALEGKDIEVLLTLGAGDIDLFRRPISEWMQKNYAKSKTERS